VRRSNLDNGATLINLTAMYGWRALTTEWI